MRVGVYVGAHPGKRNAINAVKTARTSEEGERRRGYPESTTMAEQQKSETHARKPPVRILILIVHQITVFSESTNPTKREKEEWHTSNDTNKTKKLSNPTKYLHPRSRATGHSLYQH